MRSKYLPIILLICLLMVTVATAEVSLTVYQRNMVLIHDTRVVDLEKGENIIIFDYIAPGIYESTLRITPVGDSGIETIEQNYEYDLADQDRIWRKYLGKDFSFTKDDSLYSGILLKLDDDFIYLEPAGQAGAVSMIDRSGLDDMTFNALPDGIVLHPEIHWKVKAGKKQNGLKVDISYLADGMTWQADYNAQLVADDKVKLQGNLTLTNSLELDFEEADVVLMAGEPHRAYDNRTLAGNDEFAEAQVGIPEKETRFFEYRRYKVPGKTSLHNNQTKGLPLIGPVDVACVKDFYYDGSAGTGEVLIRLRMDNSKEAGLGIGLPEGDLLLYKNDGDDKTQFLGEDHLEASSPGDEVELLIGKAFDIRADRRRISHQRIARNRTRDEVEITFTSSRTQASKITVRERLYGFWEISEANWNGQPIQHRVEHANMIEFDVELAPGQSSTLKYSVEYGY